MSELFSENLRNAIALVASAIASELEVDEDEFVTILAETTIDANRLTVFGHKQADEELHKLIAEHGYPTVFEEAKKHVGY